MKKSQNLIQEGGLHRGRLVQEEHWVQLGDWFLGPGDYENMYAAWAWKFILAHKCPDGKISAPIGVGVYKSKTTGWTLYGKCRKCKAPIGKKLQFLFRLLKARL